MFHLIWLSSIQFIFDFNNGMFVCHGVLLRQHTKSYIDINGDFFVSPYKIYSI